MKKIFFTLLLIPVFMFAGTKTDIKNPENKESMNATKLLKTETECVLCKATNEDSAELSDAGCIHISCTDCYFSYTSASFSISGSFSYLSFWLCW